MLRMRITTMALVLALAAVACSDEVGGREARLQRASQGLCDAQVHAFEANVRRAAAVFDAESHAFLHELAADLEDIDRAAAANLLEAKQRVERALVDPIRSDPQEVILLLAGLQRALGEAAEATGLPAPLCRNGAS